MRVCVNERESERDRERERERENETKRLLQLLSVGGIMRIKTIEINKNSDPKTRLLAYH